MDELTQQYKDSSEHWQREWDKVKDQLTFERRAAASQIDRLGQEISMHKLRVNDRDIIIAELQSKLKSA